MRATRRKYMLKEDPGNLLAPVFDAYRHRLVEGRYVPGIQAFYFAAVFHFGDWLRATGVALSEVRHEHVCRFLGDHMPACICDRHTRGDPQGNRAALHLLERVMQDGNFAVTRPMTTMQVELESFDAKMKEVWGYSDSTRAARCLTIGRFLGTRFGEQDIVIARISVVDITRFVVGDGNRGTSSSRGISGAIRCYLRYRQFVGDDVAHLLAGMPKPSRPKPAELPEVLTGSEVDMLLQSFAMDFPRRRRAFAIARCLIDLGLRSGEVAGLTLDDIDWGRGTIRVGNRKGRRSDVMPLLEATGRALADYILNERPYPACRNIFVRQAAPVGQPVGRRAVQATMLAAYSRLGWDRTRVHILRHTLATRLLSAGAPMPVIANVMRHRSLSTTTIYTKLDTTWLSRVSLAWPGGVQ